MKRAAIFARAFAIAAVLVSILAACSDLDEGQYAICRNVLPAIEPEGTISIVSAGTDASARFGIRIVYSITEAGTSHNGILRCAFGGGRLDDRRLDLLAVEAGGEAFGEARFLFLKRFWLGEPDTVAAGQLRIRDAETLPLVPVPVGVQAGYFLQQAANAMPIGAVYALLAIAYALVYGLIGRINLAFGEIAVIGSFVLANAIGLAAATGNESSALALGGTVAAAAMLAALVAGLAGLISGRWVFQPLAGAGPRAFLIATIGLAVAISEALRLISRSRDVWIQPLLNAPILLASGGFRVTITSMQLLEVGLTAIVLAVVWFIIARTPAGRVWKAVSDDPLMSRFLGVDPLRVAAATAVASAMLAGMAGAITTLQFGHAAASAGLIIGLKALVAALLGGIGSLPGAAAGGFILGLAETLWAAYLPFDQRDIAVLALLVIVLILRPNGLFGTAPPDPDGGDTRWRRLG